MHNNTQLILVTGGAGYIGSALIPRLLERGYRVRVFDKCIFGDIALSSVKDKIELIKGDVKNPPPDIMAGVFGVIHLAGLSTEPTSYFNPRHTDQVNHLGTENIAKLAKAARVDRFVFASSCSVYFTYETPIMPPFYKEEDRVNSISPYSLSKRAAEEAVLELVDHEFKPIIFRKGTIYGFAPKMRYDLVLNSFVKDAFSRRKITVNAGGEIYRPMLDIQDAVAAYIAALELPLSRTGGQTFNVVGSNWKIGELASFFQQHIKNTRNTLIDVEINPGGIARNYRSDGTKFQDAFGLQPSRSLEEAIFEMWNNLERGYPYEDLIYYNDLWQQKLAEQGNMHLI